MGTEIFKIEEEMTEKMKPKVATPPPKMGRILCSQYTLIDPLSHSLGHYGPWTWHIRPRVQNYLYFTFYQCVEQVLLSLQIMKMQRIIKGVHIVSSEFCPFFEGGLATLGLTFSVIFLQFWKSQCPSGSKYHEFSKTPPPFAFWISLKVVMAVFPRNDIFFETLCTHTV